jgi:hypothetical protein
LAALDRPPFKTRIHCHLTSKKVFGSRGVLLRILSQPWKGRQGRNLGAFLYRDRRQLIIITGSSSSKDKEKIKKDCCC